LGRCDGESFASTEGRGRSRKAFAVESKKRLRNLIEAEIRRKQVTFGGKQNVSESKTPIFMKTIRSNRSVVEDVSNVWPNTNSVVDYLCSTYRKPFSHSADYND